MSRPYDIVVYGATGYTGTITCEYLAQHRKNEKLAIAGRSKDKLEQLKADMVAINASCKDVDVIVCDASDESQLKAMTAKGRVCISFVGPYRRFGEPVFRACVETGTDYVDATGEPPFVTEMIEKYHEEAARKKIYLMPACAAGSLIEDVGMEALKESYTKEGSKVVEGKGYVRYNGRYAKTFSNGTWGTFVNSMGSRAPRPRRDPNAAPVKKSRGPKAGFHYYAYNKTWAVPFVEGADLYIVRRTNELTQTRTGHADFGYAQFSQFPLLPPLYTIWAVLTVLLLMYLAKIPFLRKWLAKRTFDNGGPTKEQRQGCSYEYICDAKDDKGKRKRLHMKCPGSPYDVSGFCCAEAALCLLHDRKDLQPIYGVVTPGAIMSEQIQNRLRKNAGCDWTIA